MLVTKFLNWEKCSFNDYKSIALDCGFNAESSPFIIEFAINNGAKLDFFLFKKGSNILGACCVDNGWLCNDAKNPKSQTSLIQIPHYSIRLPFRSNVNCLIPFKSKHLSRNNQRVFNSSFNFFSKRNVAISKNSDEFSKKTISTRSREMRKFLDAGGSFYKSSDFDANTIYSIYDDLFSKRRPGKNPNEELHRGFFNSFKNCVVGDVAMINSVPVAFQFNLATQSNYGLFVDFINIGYDPKIKEHSLGTIMMWHNLKLIEKLAADSDSELTYSYGMMSGEYKSRWCKAERVGRILSL